MPCRRAVRVGTPCARVRARAHAVSRAARHGPQRALGRRSLLAYGRAQARYEKSMTERAEAVTRLMTDTRLRSDIEIANERPEGSSMAKGGKEEFLQQVKAGEYDE